MLERGFLEDTRHDELRAGAKARERPPRGTRKRQGENELMGFALFCFKHNIVFISFHWHKVVVDNAGFHKPVSSVSCALSTFVTLCPSLSPPLPPPPMSILLPCLLLSY